MLVLMMVLRMLGRQLIIAAAHDYCDGATKYEVIDVLV